MNIQKLFATEKKKKLIFSGIVIITIIALPITIWLTQQRQDLRQRAAVGDAVTITTNPSSLPATTKGDFDVNIILESKQNDVTAVDIVLKSSDASELEIVSFQPTETYTHVGKSEPQNNGTSIRYVGVNSTNNPITGGSSGQILLGKLKLRTKGYNGGSIVVDTSSVVTGAGTAGTNLQIGNKEATIGTYMPSCTVTIALSKSNPVVGETITATVALNNSNLPFGGWARNTLYEYPGTTAKNPGLQPVAGYSNNYGGRPSNGQYTFKAREGTHMLQFAVEAYDGSDNQRTSAYFCSGAATYTATKAVNSPVPTATHTPTPSPTRTPTATNTPVPPTATNTPKPTATQTPAPGATIFSLSIGLPGVNVRDPQRLPHQKAPTPKEVTVEVFDTSNKKIADTKATLTYGGETTYFFGTADFGNKITQSGPYTVKVSTKRYLTKLIPTIQNITVGKMNTITPVQLVVGDITGDNVIDALDYNILQGCFGKTLQDAVGKISCTMADLNDDGLMDHRGDASAGIRGDESDFRVFAQTLREQRGD